MRAHSARVDKNCDFMFYANAIADAMLGYPSGSLYRTRNAYTRIKFLFGVVMTKATHCLGF